MKFDSFQSFEDLSHAVHNHCRKCARMSQLSAEKSVLMLDTLMCTRRQRQVGKKQVDSEGVVRSCLHQDVKRHSLVDLGRVSLVLCLHCPRSVCATSHASPPSKKYVHFTPKISLPLPPPLPELVHLKNCCPFSLSSPLSSSPLIPLSSHQPLLSNLTVAPPTFLLPPLPQRTMSSESHFSTHLPAKEI